MKHLVDCGVFGDVGEEGPGCERRNKVPVIFVRGNHYDIGFDVGRTFSSMIKEFISMCERLRRMEAEYKTEAGRVAYDRTLANMERRLPHYVAEVRGTADGARVPFYQLFLLQMDDIMETINENLITRNDVGGCSSVGMIGARAAVLGHTEDAFAETLNHLYIVSAHVVPSPEHRARGAVEERFSSLCYAGQLPGYTMGHTARGLVFSVNTLSPRHLKPGHTPRTFLARAMLSAASQEQVERILRDEGLGAANGFSVNLLWAGAGGDGASLYNAEVAPDPAADRSIVHVHKFAPDELLIHCNRYDRVKVPEVRGPIIDSSASRLAALHARPAPRRTADVRDILSDRSGDKYPVFQNDDDAVVKTIAAGIFDMESRVWDIYIQAPNSSDPVASLPIIFSAAD